MKAVGMQTPAAHRTTWTLGLAACVTAAAAGGAQLPSAASANARGATVAIGGGAQREVAAPDSVSILDAARGARARFERVRLAALPIVDQQGSQACDASIGRMCYWHDASAKPPVEREPLRVTHARRALLEALDVAGRELPGDRWIVGQRVRYHLDAGDTVGAVHVAAAECRASGWWCDALRGYARHIARDFSGALTAFTLALRAMSPADRCEWDTPAVLLDPRRRRALLAMPCAAREAVNARIWWLGTPLLSMPANDLRTEFFARQVDAILEADARHLHDTRWDWDSRELLLRYGTPTWFTRARYRSVTGVTSVAMVGHERVPSFDFLPAGDLPSGATIQVAAEDWAPARRSPVSRYGPAYVGSWSDADAQVARFVRGDSLVVIASYAARGDSMLRAPLARLAVSPRPGAPRYLSAAVAGNAGVLAASVPRDSLYTPGLASVELVDRATGAVARYRTSIPDLPRDARALSDLLLHTPRDPAPPRAILGEIAPRALDRLTVRRGRVGVYWETYGLPPAGALVDVELTLEPLDASWPRRLAVRAGLAARATPFAIRWRATPEPTGATATHSVTIDLAAITPGDYRLSLRVRGGDGGEAGTARLITVVP